MIYATAETAQEIAQLLRGEGEKFIAGKVADRLLGKKESSGIVITSPRRSGKTTELLKYAEEKNPNGDFCVVCRDIESQTRIIHQHWLLFNRIDQSDVVAKRLLGEPLGGVGVTPPLMLNPSNLHLLRGQGSPVYVDEWALLPEDAQRTILDSGLLIAAVTS